MTINVKKCQNLIFYVVYADNNNRFLCGKYGYLKG